MFFNVSGLSEQTSVLLGKGTAGYKQWRQAGELQHEGVTGCFWEAIFEV